MRWNYYNSYLTFCNRTDYKEIRGINECYISSIEEGKFQGISNTLLNILLFIFILIAIYTDLGLYGIAIAYITANIIALIYCYYVLTKHLTKPNYEFDK